MTEELRNIVEKVYTLYIKYGIKSVTMDDVAHELGISKKTLYQYVTDKTDLVKKVVDFERIVKTDRYEQITGSGRNAIEELFEVRHLMDKLFDEYSPTYMYDLKKYYPGIFREMMEDRREKMYQAILQNILKGKKEGLYRENLEAEIISKIYLARLENMHDGEFFCHEEVHSGKFIREVLNYHIRGIATEKGLAMLTKHLDKIQVTA